MEQGPCVFGFEHYREAGEEEDPFQEDVDEAGDFDGQTIVLDGV